MRGGRVQPRGGLTAQEPCLLQSVTSPGDVLLSARATTPRIKKTLCRASSAGSRKAEEADEEEGKARWDERRLP